MLDPQAAPELDGCDRHKVLASLDAPKAGFGTVDCYPTLEEKASALLYAFAKNHACPNGNKRLALVVSMGFIQENNFFLWVNKDDLEARVLGIASSDAGNADAVRADTAQWIKASVIPLMEASLRIQAGKTPERRAACD